MKKTSGQSFLFFFLGLLFGVIIITIGSNILIENIILFTIIFAVIFSLSIIVSLMLWVYKDAILEHFFGNVETELVSLLNPAKAGINNLLDGNPKETVENLEKIARVLLTRYASHTMRRWIIGINISLLASFTGMIGSALLFKQNTLIDEQNRHIVLQNDTLTKQNLMLGEQNHKIDAQTKLDEAARRANLTFEITSINETIENIREKLEHTAINQPINLPDHLVGRIISLSKVAEPYFYLDSSKLTDSESIINLIKTPLSPERALLLRNLLSGEIANAEEIIKSGLDLSFADLRRVSMEGIDFSRALLSRANFSFSKLDNIRFDKSRLDGADFSSAQLGVGLTSNMDFSYADLRSADFGSSIVSNTNFSHSVLVDATFKGSQFDKVDLTGAIVENQDWLKNMMRDGVIDPSFADKWILMEEYVDMHPVLDDGVYWKVKRKDAGQ